ncbi:4-alpha-glucanotransferase [Tatumella morbirosei]|uniref:4-alpha-glucanotransferase n=1 Tax=Tatumella morbirosei TaxID=642227 RepID=A0A095TDI8_9GAMM|nr:4-alpha-glucanotransferase [Tatumella morbirosei]KGD74762.1 4-alpha-glucanotransferase [Tatumella morbirosei]
MDNKALEQAAREAGISSGFINAHGKQQETAPETRQKLLDAMNFSHRPVPEFSPVPGVRVFTAGGRLALPVSGNGEYQWLLQQENVTRQQGRISGEMTLVLPGKIPAGYHQLTLSRDEQQWHCRVIVAPKRCFEPEALLSGKKLWGACIQLYTLRSENNWGIGDFGDLRQFLPQIAERGGAFVGLNPIHALYPANPTAASPYSPSTRRWLNIIYIDVNAIEDFRLSDEAQQWWALPQTQNRLKAARAAEFVDYSEVMSLKLAGLRLAYQQFVKRPARDPQVKDLAAFSERGGESLRLQAVFDALYQHLAETRGEALGWNDWPQEYHDARGKAVQQFCEQHTREVGFYCWLQWLAETQLVGCYEVSQQHEMPIGLYRDLAVGIVRGGSETWDDGELFCLDASVGAPPDILGPQGQNWDLRPMDPWVMARRGYQPFIDMLRANMTHCGALRIDHVMNLLRLWWIPAGETADKGAYVRYPVDDLLAILALESHRLQCMVIGEDLGTVPVEIVSKLRESGVYSYKVLYFEQDEENHFRAPQSYPQQAMATLTTHDLPTLRGYWQADDLTLGKTLGLYRDQEVLEELYADRARARQGLLDALHHYDCIPKKTGHRAALMEMTPVLNRGLQRYVADSACALLGLQPEDWLDMATPVNIPGTNTEYPNWRRKLSHTLEEIFADEHINKLIKDLDKRRKKVSVG